MSRKAVQSYPSSPLRTVLQKSCNYKTAKLSNLPQKSELSQILDFSKMSAMKTWWDIWPRPRIWCQPTSWRQQNPNYMEPVGTDLWKLPPRGAGKILLQQGTKYTSKNFIRGDKNYKSVLHVLLTLPIGTSTARKVVKYLICFTVEPQPLHNTVVVICCHKELPILLVKLQSLGKTPVPWSMREAVT